MMDFLRSYQIKERHGATDFVKNMGDSMAAKQNEFGFISCLDFWLLKLKNQEKFVTLMGRDGIMSHLLIDIVNDRMIFWCDLLGVDNFFTIIIANAVML